MPRFSLIVSFLLLVLYSIILSISRLCRENSGRALSKIDVLSVSARLGRTANFSTFEHPAALQDRPHCIIYFTCSTSYIDEDGQCCACKINKLVLYLLTQTRSRQDLDTLRYKKLKIYRFVIGACTSVQSRPWYRSSHRMRMGCSFLCLERQRRLRSQTALRCPSGTQSNSRPSLVRSQPSSPIDSGTFAGPSKPFLQNVTSGFQKKVRLSQTRAVPSREPVTIWFPSREMAMLRMLLSWPVSLDPA